MKQKIVILGTAHMELIQGKSSPDKTLKEWQYSRQLCHAIQKSLLPNNVNCIVDLPIPNVSINPRQSQRQLQLTELSDRVALVNAYCDLYGKTNVTYVSCHINAAGMGDKWLNHRGWCCHTSKGNTLSDILSEYMYNSAKVIFPKDFTFYEDWSDGDADIESDLYVLRKTNCPAVLTENFFMDNIEDVDFLQSKVGFQSIVQVHTTAILNYLDYLKTQQG